TYVVFAPMVFMQSSALIASPYRLPFAPSARSFREESTSLRTCGGSARGHLPGGLGPVAELASPHKEHIAPCGARGEPVLALVVLVAVVSVGAEHLLAR